MSNDRMYTNLSDYPELQSFLNEENFTASLQSLKETYRLTTKQNSETTLTPIEICAALGKKPQVKALLSKAYPDDEPLINAICQAIKSRSFSTAYVICKHNLPLISKASERINQSQNPTNGSFNMADHFLVFAINKTAQRAFKNLSKKLQAGKQEDIKQLIRRIENYVVQTIPQSTVDVNPIYDIIGMLHNMLTNKNTLEPISYHSNCLTTKGFFQSGKAFRTIASAQIGISKDQPFSAMR